MATWGMLPAAAPVMSRPQHLKLVYNVQETNTARLTGEFKIKLCWYDDLFAHPKAISVKAHWRGPKKNLSVQSVYWLTKAR